MLRMEATCNLGDYSDENYNDEENRLSYKRPETNKHSGLQSRRREQSQRRRTTGPFDRSASTSRRIGACGSK